MEKKVLILSSSPRKGGNSDVLCDEFMNGAIDGGNKVEKIFLGDKNINCCTGCYACGVNGGKCVQNDDMEEILMKIIESDVIVLSTPVYFYTMAAQLKMVIDRTVAKYREIKNKDFYFIATAADSNNGSLERTMEGLRGFLDCLDGAKEKGVIYGTGVWQKGDVKNTGLLKEAYDMGKSIL